MAVMNGTIDSVKENTLGERVARLEESKNHVATKADVANLRTWVMLIVLASETLCKVVIPSLFPV